MPDILCTFIASLESEDTFKIRTEPMRFSPKYQCVGTTYLEKIKSMVICQPGWPQQDLMGEEAASPTNQKRDVLKTTRSNIEYDPRDVYTSETFRIQALDIP